MQFIGALPSPFGAETIDRSQPALLQSVRDLSQYHPAAGNYQVVIDIEQDIKNVPAVLAGERTLFVAAGSVDAYIDLGGLADDGLTVSTDRRGVEVRLPAPLLDKPNLDQEHSYVFSQRRGLLDRLGSMVSTPNQQPYYLAAEKRISSAAAESGLVDRARENTKAMLSGLFGVLGFRVTFVDGG
ncbi:DUF4230 domain-containing protein [Solihabitans fulvus]|uniref:DUF4230 domain-containing protein n=1 Tax=Solihabitans fulvus TaxID=1892852 RepID=A0A5B2XER4_9PSEU|nr:DUF4230 domain-containing protein [Solihabitans fulvus]KAA2261282.1 DUF4230 domain-containing protein [Solihabitans fulvus]